jgi:hypothetical protein
MVAIYALTQKIKVIAICVYAGEVTTGERLFVI